MSNNLMIFEGNDVEVFEFEGKVLFNPRHVGECLKLSDSALAQAVKRMGTNQKVKIKNSDILKGTNCTFRKLHNTGENFITESGVYKLIFLSRTTEAERFQDWVTDEVLPTIRQTGSYSVAPQVDSYMIDNPIERAKAWIKEREEYEKEQQLRIEAESKVDRLVHTDKTYSATEMAKELGFSSARKFNETLHEMKIQYKVGRCWTLYAAYADKGYMEIKQEELHNGNIAYYSKWTGEGRQFLLELFNE